MEDTKNSSIKVKALIIIFPQLAAGLSQGRP